MLASPEDLLCKPSLWSTCLSTYLMKKDVALSFFNKIGSRKVSSKR